MRALCALTTTTSLRLLTFVLLSFFCLAGTAAAATCSDYATYSIRITNDTINNTTKYNIFPIIDTPTNGADEWLQAGFNVPNDDIATRTYGHDSKYRMYIKPMVGLAPGESATVSLPLCTQLVPGNPTGLAKDEYIDWWTGGRVYIYDSPVGAGAPAALLKDFNRDKLNEVQPNPLNSPRPSCVGCPLTNPPIYRDPTALPSNDPMQLTEYTLAGLLKQKIWSLNPVPETDFDISYVDHVYLPAAMGPIGASDIGFIGTISPIPEFRASMLNFLNVYQDWPRYIDPTKTIATPYLRIPGTYNAFAEGTTRIDHAGVKSLTDLWKNCTTSNDPTPPCPAIRDVQAFFQDNYSQYRTLWGQGFCTPPDPPKTPTAPFDQMIKKVYGWVPWNENCGTPNQAAKTNSLANTPHYVTTHPQYVQLQYSSMKISDRTRQFNPYVKLVHGAKPALDMQGSYAFSVDDDVGNMQIAGATGINISIGGPAGLDNKIPFDKTKLVNVSLGAGPNEPLWGQYGFCDGTPTRNIKSPQYPAFAITSVIYPCKVGLKDVTGRQFVLTITDPADFAPGPPPTTNPLDPKYTAPIKDCTVNGKPNTVWCQNAFAYTTGAGLNIINHVQLRAPPQVF
jgi:hypothetical protein